MTAQIARYVIESFRQEDKLRDELTHPSVREEQILMLLSQGYQNNVIADKLELSINTVCTHLKNVFKKLQVSSRTEALVRYIESKTPQQAGRLAGLLAARTPAQETGNCSRNTQLAFNGNSYNIKDDRLKFGRIR